MDGHGSDPPTMDGPGIEISLVLQKRKSVIISYILVSIQINGVLTLH